MERPQAFRSSDGERLRLVHGPIDLLIGADGQGIDACDTAFSAAQQRFGTILAELTDELPVLRSACRPEGLNLRGVIARRMEAAAMSHAHDSFVTPMAAVAGAVAEEILSAMLARVSLSRAYVNNGGDIALHLSGAAGFVVEMAAFGGAGLGAMEIAAKDSIRGIATSGRTGRSLSLGIADAVTVLARSASQADVAATLIANAVDLPGHPGISRRPASALQPESDLGDRLVVVGCDGLSDDDSARALERGLSVAEGLAAADLIGGAALFLAGQSRVAGACLKIGPAPAITQTRLPEPFA